MRRWELIFWFNRSLGKPKGSEGDDGIANVGEEQESRRQNARAVNLVSLATLRGT